MSARPAPTTDRRGSRARLTGGLGRLPATLALLGAALFAGLPVLWLATSALKRPDEITRLPPVWLPGQPSLDAFAEAFRLLPLGNAFLNSFLIAGVSTAAVVATSTAAGWAFAIYRFRGREQLFLLLLATMFVPPIATLVPLYWLVQSAGLLDSLVGVLVPQLANAFGIYLIRQFARGVPRELIDAARADGASEWRILLSVGVPLMRPAIATLAMFAFVFYWNAYLWPLVVLQSPDHYTVVLVVNQLLSYTTAVRYANVIYAGTLLAIVPNVVLFLFVRRAYADVGFSSAVKG